MADEGDDTGPLLDDLRMAAEQLLDDRKGRAADLVKGTAALLRRAAATLEANRIGTAAGFADRAAGELDRLGDTVRERPLSSLASDAGDLARREPAWFAAGAAAAGFLLGRLVKTALRSRP